MDNQSFGLMNNAYFVSRREILDWINKLLKLDLHCIEQLGTGAVSCQLVDAYMPDVVQMGNVNWKAKNEHEFITNFKILQKSFVKLGLNKKIDVP